MANDAPVPLHDFPATAALAPDGVHARTRDADAQSNATDDNRPPLWPNASRINNRLNPFAAFIAHIIQLTSVLLYFVPAIAIGPDIVDDFSGFARFVKGLGIGLALAMPPAIILVFVKELSQRSKDGRKQSCYMWDWVAVGTAIFPYVVCLMMLGLAA